MFKLKLNSSWMGGKQATHAHGCDTVALQLTGPHIVMTEQAFLVHDLSNIRAETFSERKKNFLPIISNTQTRHRDHTRMHYASVHCMTGFTHTQARLCPSPLRSRVSTGHCLQCTLQESCLGTACFVPSLVCKALASNKS